MQIGIAPFVLIVAVGFVCSEPALAISLGARCNPATPADSALIGYDTNGIYNSSTIRSATVVCSDEVGTSFLWGAFTLTAIDVSPTAAVCCVGYALPAGGGAPISSAPACTGTTSFSNSPVHLSAFLTTARTPVSIHYACTIPPAVSGYGASYVSGFYFNGGAV